MACWYCPQSLVKVPFWASVIWRGERKSWLVWYVFIQCCSLIPCIILIFFAVLNVAEFVTLGYLDKNFVILWNSSLQIQTAWSKIPHVVGEYNQFYPFLQQYPQRLNLMGALCHRDKSIPGGSILHMISCVYIWPGFLLNKKYISCGSGLLIELICWSTSSSPYTGKIPLGFITVDGGESCSSISVCWSLNFVDWPHSPYNWVIIVFFVSNVVIDYYCYDSYRLNWRCSVV